VKQVEVDLLERGWCSILLVEVMVRCSRRIMRIYIYIYIYSS